MPFLKDSNSCDQLVGPNPVLDHQPYGVGDLARIDTRRSTVQLEAV